MTPPAPEQAPWGQRAYDWFQNHWGGFGQMLGGVLDYNDDQRLGFGDAFGYGRAFALGGPAGILGAGLREGFSDNWGKGKGLDWGQFFDRQSAQGAGSYAGVDAGQMQVDPGQGTGPGEGRKYAGYMGPPVWGGMMDASYGGPNDLGMGGAITQRMGGGGNPMSLYGGNPAAMFWTNAALRQQHGIQGYPMPGGMGGGTGGFLGGGISTGYPGWDPAQIPQYLPPGFTRDPVNPMISQTRAYEMPMPGGGPPIPIIEGPRWMGAPWNPEMAYQGMGGY